MYSPATQSLTGVDTQAQAGARSDRASTVAETNSPCWSPIGATMGAMSVDAGKPPTTDTAEQSVISITSATAEVGQRAVHAGAALDPRGGRP